MYEGVGDTNDQGGGGKHTRSGQVTDDGDPRDDSLQDWTLKNNRKRYLKSLTALRTPVTTAM